MADFQDPGNIAALDLQNDGDIPKIAALCDALGSEARLKILRCLQSPPYIFTVTQLVKTLNIPTTTLLFHLEKMQTADLVNISYKSSTHGTHRLIARKLHGADLRFYYVQQQNVKSVSSFVQTIGVGQFNDFIGTSFNFCTADSHYTSLSDNCYLPERFNAQLVYTPNGQITYRFSNQTAKLYAVKELALTLELCSEAPYFDNNYLSDITFWINGKELTTYTCPGDFGDHRGLLNPDWWSSVNTQYGILLTLTVNEKGVYLNGAKTPSKITLNDLEREKGNKIEVRLGNKPTAVNLGGFNIFGKQFGDHPQDVTLIMTYEDPKR